MFVRALHEVRKVKVSSKETLKIEKASKLLILIIDGADC